jgi:hypothetical protein
MYIGIYHAVQNMLSISSVGTRLFFLGQLKTPTVSKLYSTGWEDVRRISTIEKDFEERGCGLFEVPARPLLGRTQENHEKPQLQ